MSVNWKIVSFASVISIRVQIYQFFTMFQFQYTCRLNDVRAKFCNIKSECVFDVFHPPSNRSNGNFASLPVACVLCDVPFIHFRCTVGSGRNPLKAILYNAVLWCIRRACVKHPWSTNQYCMKIETNQNAHWNFLMLGSNACIAWCVYLHVSRSDWSIQREMKRNRKIACNPINFEHSTF